MEVFGAVTEEAARVLDTDAVAMLRLEPDGTATLVAQSQTPSDPLPLGTRFARVDDYANALGERARSVAAPIVVEGRLWGSLIAVTSRSAPLPPDTEARIALFTELAATAIARGQRRVARLPEWATGADRRL